VSAGEECNQELFNDICLTNEHLADIGFSGVNPIGEVLDACCISHVIFGCLGV
jgi:hypothetical protein